MLLMRTHDGLASNGLLYCPASATVDHQFFFNIFNNRKEASYVLHCVIN